ncbi:MAG: glycosyltransferase [Pseudomonadota bacterium]
MKLVLHVGWHKTGTTAVQYALQQLRRRSVPAETAILDRDGEDIALKHWLYPEWRGLPDDALLRRRAHQRLGEIAQRHRGRRVIWSEENFSQELETPLQRRAQERLEEVLEILRPDALEVHLFLRDQADFVESLYTTRIGAKTCRYRDIRAMLARTPAAHEETLSWPSAVAGFVRLVGAGSLSVHSYEAAASRGLLASAFAAFGLPAPVESIGPRLNTRLSERLVAVIEEAERRAAEGLLDADELGWIKTAALRAAPHATGTPYRMPDALHAAFRAHYAAGNADFAAGGGFTGASVTGEWSPIGARISGQSRPPAGPDSTAQGADAEFFGLIAGLASGRLSAARHRAGATAPSPAAEPAPALSPPGARGPRLSRPPSPLTDPALIELEDRIRSRRVAAVSFDIFDTAILRPFLEPADLFDFLQPRLRVIAGRGALDLAGLRRQAERAIRHENEQARRGTDPHLAAIWDRVAQLAGLDPETTAALMAEEEQAELRLCYGNETVRRLAALAKAEGKQVAFCSDTYLSREIVALILSRAGFEGWDALLVSCEDGATKKHGPLFDRLAQTLGVSASKILHLGDNATSDVLNGRRSGLHTRLIESPRDRFLRADGPHAAFWRDPRRLEQPMRSLLAMYANRLGGGNLSNSTEERIFAGDLSNFGYGALGPFLYALLSWIEREMRARGLGHVVFLARDGYLPLEGWQALGYDEDGTIEARYLHISRRAVLPLMIETGDPAGVLLGVPVSPDYTLERFFAARFEPAEAEAMLALAVSEGLAPAGTVASQCDALTTILRDNQAKIREILAPAAARARAYLEERLPEEPFALFDVGRKGTFQNLFTTIFGRNVTGFYVVTEGPVGQNMPAGRCCSFFGPVPRFLMPDEPDTVIFEVLLSSHEGSTIGYTPDGCPQLEAGQDGKNGQDASGKAFIRDVQEGALALLRDSRALFGRSLDSHAIAPRLAAHLLLERGQEPADREILNALPHEDSLSFTASRRIDDYYGRAGAGVSAVEEGGSLYGESAATRALLNTPRGPKIVFYSPAQSSIRGGAERITAYLARYLEAQGYQVEILTRGTGPERSLYPVGPHCRVLHIALNDIRALRRQIAASAPDALVVMASGSVVATLLLATIGLGIPVMLSERAFPENSRQQDWVPQLRPFYSLVYAVANRPAVQLPSFRRCFPWLMRFKIRTLPNPVFPMPVPETSTDATGAGRPPPREKLVVCLARINLPQKRQDVLLCAFARLSERFPDWRLELWGDANPTDQFELSKLIEEFGLAERVSVIGSTRDVQAVLARASVFAFPSLYEGFPNALAEALAAGVPAVGFAACPGTNELILDGENGFLAAPDGDPAAFAEALGRIMGDETLRQRLAQNCVESVRPYAPEQVLALWKREIDALIRLRRNPFSTVGAPATAVLRRLFPLVLRLAYSIYLREKGSTRD